MHVRGRSTSIGDGVAEYCHDRGLGIRLHIDGREIVPVIHVLLLAEGCIGRTDWFAIHLRYYIRCGTRTTMRSGILRRFLTIINGDGETLTRLQCIFQHIRVESFAWFENYVFLAAELQILHGLGIDAAILVLVGISHIDRANLHRVLAELIAQFESHLIATERHMDNLTAGTIAQTLLRHIFLSSLFDCGSPSTLPYILRLQSRASQGQESYHQA